MKYREIYLDVCLLSRPFDDQGLLRIRLETDAFFLIMKHVQASDYVLLYSAVHEIEIEAIPDTLEKESLQKLLSQYGRKIKIKNKAVLQERVKRFNDLGLGIADAAHLAFAELSAGVLVSCDDIFIRRAGKIKPLIPALGPVQFIQQEALK